jgi:hypothetical protein
VLQACRRLDHLEAQIHPDAISPRAVRALHRAAPLPRLDLSVLAAYSDVEIAREPVLSVRIRT